MDPEKKNWRIRYHLPDAIVGLGKKLDAESLRTKVIPFYNSLIKDTEHGYRIGYFAFIFSVDMSLFVYFSAYIYGKFAFYSSSESLGFFRYRF